MDIFLVSVIIASVLGLNTGSSVPPIYVTNGTHVISYVKGDSDVSVVVGKAGYRIVGLAVDIADGYLFWSDISFDNAGIYRSDLQGNGVVQIVKDVGEVNGLSVDWVSDHVYWTDTEHKTIEVANYDGGGRRVLISSGLRQPRSIVAAPLFGYIFWADQRAKRIERAWMDGSHRRVILKSKLYWPNQLAISHDSKKLFWVDARANGVYSCSMRGQGVRAEQGLTDIAQGAPGYGLALHGSRAVVSTWFTTAIYSLVVGTDHPAWTEEISGLGTRELFSLVSLHPSTQPRGEHPCGEEGRAGCSHMCLPGQDADYHCSCPTYGGLALAVDKHTCTVPSELLLCTLQDSGDVGFISLDDGATGDVSMVGHSAQPRAVAYDPVDQVVYWSDIADRSIYSRRLDATKPGTLLNSSRGVGLVHAMAFDWRSRRLYFSNVGQSAPTLDGTVYRWHRVEWLHVVTGDRKSLMFDVEEPAGLALDLEHGYLYVTDAGSHPRVVRTDLDGTHRRVVRDWNVSNPGRVAVSGGLVYVTDTNADNRTDGASLLVYDTTDDTWRDDDTPAEQVPYGVAARGDTVYYTELLSRTLVAQTLDSSELLLKLRKIGDIFYSPTRTETTAGDYNCDDTGCSHGCVQLSGDNIDPARCVCPDQQALVLGNDGKTCVRPRNFLLVADMTTINMLSLDPGTTDRPLVLHYGDVNSNYVALTYDKEKDRVYWTEHGSNSIYQSELSRMSPILVYTDTGPIDGLAIDAVRQRLYWTVVASESGPGFVARLNIARGAGSYRRLHVDRNSPRTITIDPHGKWLFWTEHRDGDAGSEVHVSKVNGHRPRLLITSGLQWPNSLVAQDDMLFIGDGNGKLLVADLEGNAVRDVTDSTENLGHVFGLGVLQNILVYSDWKERSVQMLNVISGHRRSLADNLTRPTALTLHHPGDLSDSVCYGASRPCVDVCLPLLRGQYECLCTRNHVVDPDSTDCLTDIRSTPNPNRISDAVSTEQEDIYEHDVIQTTPTRPSSATPTTPATPVSGDVWDYVTPASHPTHPTYKISSLTTRTTKNYDQTPETSTRYSETITSARTTYNTPKVMGSRDKQASEGVLMSTKPTTTQEIDGMSRHSTADDSEVGRAHMAGGYDVLHTEGLPYFENCPASDTIIITVPDTDNTAVYPDTPVAYDAGGIRLPVQSSHNVTDRGVALRWEGTDQESRYMLVFSATDAIQQRVLCEFVVVLQDTSPPVFTVCPDDVIVRIKTVTEFVSWPEPEAVDNVGVRDVEGSHVSGSLFAAGETTINYTATDFAENQAHCTFRIVVLRDALCTLPEIENGGVLCSDSNQYAGECSIQCQPGFVVNPVRVFRRKFNCRHPDDINAVKDTMNTQRPCLPRLPPSVVQQEFRLRFQGAIGRHREEVTAYLTIAIAGHLERERLCLQGVCTMGNLTVPPCGQVDPGCSVDVRGEGLVEENLVDEEMTTFFILFNITISNSSLPGDIDVDTLLGKIHWELKSLAPLLQLQLGGHKFIAIADSVTTHPATWSCVDGQITEENICIACPLGTLHNRSLGVCQYCRAGEFQDSEGQLACIRCEPGETSQNGAITRTQCTAIPSMDEMTLFVIVSACSFGVVFLCMAITLYLQFQRQQKRNRKAAASGQKKPRYNMSPNIYVAPPPILKSKLYDDNSSLGQRTYSIDKKQPIHFFANHDYEAVEQNAMNDSVYQNDVSPVNSGYGVGSNNYSPGEEVATGTLTRQNTFSSKSPNYGGYMSSRANTPTSATLPAVHRKLSFDSSFSNYSPQTVHSQRTPSSDGPLITQSPMLRLKLAAYNLNSDD